MIVAIPNRFLEPNTPRRRPSTAPSARPWGSRSAGIRPLLHPTMASFLVLQLPSKQNTQYTIHPRDIQSSFSILQNAMQFYLLLALSGIISGSAVLAKEFTGHIDPGCFGPTTFTFTVTSTASCTRTTRPDTRSVKLPEGAQCVLYAGPDCKGPPTLINNPGCTAVPSVGSYACVLVDK